MMDPMYATVSSSRGGSSAVRISMSAARGLVPPPLRREGCMHLVGEVEGDADAVDVSVAMMDQTTCAVA